MKIKNLTFSMILLACSCSENSLNLEHQIEQILTFSVDEEINAATRGTTLDHTDPIIADGFYVTVKNPDGSDLDELNALKHITLIDGSLYEKSLTWKEGDELTFHAFYPAQVPEVLEIAPSGNPDITYTMPEKAWDHLDIVAAKSISQFTVFPVNLAFNHITSGLKFALRNTSDNNDAFIIKRISIHGFTTKASYSVANGTWDSAIPETSQEDVSRIISLSYDEELKNYADYPADKSQAFSLMKTDREAVFFPHQNTFDLEDLKLFVTVETIVDEKPKQTIIPIYGTKPISADQTLAELFASIEPGEMLELTLEYNGFTGTFNIQEEIVDWTDTFVWFPDYE